jgi:NAD(P)-dependent dehydrogenase (short-subunit alcohol dehydrogenase family)
LIAKHVLPLLPKNERSVMAFLSARVGSISDNRLGGWHAYRASKAALNMLIRNYALEMARRAPEAIILGLHPGTVDTDLSKPFQSGVAQEKLFTAEQCAAYLLDVIAARTPEDSGKVFDWAGKDVPA